MRLLLDEMFSPVVAEQLVTKRHDVLAVAADRQLRAMTDSELFVVAASRGYTLVTENVKDFRPLATAAGANETPAPHLLFTSSRRFARSRRNPGPLIAALDAWMASESHSSEEWLQTGQVERQQHPTRKGRRPR